MFGGTDPSIRDLVPADIEVIGNHMPKPLAWRQGDANYAGTAWTAQIGFPVVLTVRNQDGRAAWSVVEDVTFANNVIRGATSGINMHGRDNIHPSSPTRRLAIRNNLFIAGGPRWGGQGRLFQIVDATSAVVIAHNTAIHIGNIITAEGQYPRDNFFVSSWAEVKFEDLSQGRVRLTESPFRRAGLDGTDVGVDDNALMRSSRPGGAGRR